MDISERGLELIKEFEGLELEAYQDVVGVWTIGYGHTNAAGPPEVVPGMEITEDEATEILRRDLNQYENGVERAVKVDITQNMFDALTSITYNIGIGAMRGSTFIRRLNDGDYEGCAEAMKWWNKAGGVVFAGLVRRRNAEAALFLDGYEADDFVDGVEVADSRGAEVEENSPRRGNLASSRTIGGATAAGGAGAVGAGAAMVGNDDEQQAEDLEEDAETDEGAAAEDFAGTLACIPADDEPDPAEATSDEADTLDDNPCPDGWQVIIIAKSDEVQVVETEADAALEETEEIVVAQAEEDEVFVSIIDNQAEAADAVALSSGVMAVLSAVYVIGARWDDWRNHRR